MISVLEPVQDLARLRQKPLIFENRSAITPWRDEQRITENREFLTRVVEISNRFLAQ